MDAKRINRFLTDIAAHNNREWFAQHRAEFEACRDDFQHDVAQFINRLAEIDGGVAHLTPKDCCYRFYRDTRFSPDKSPYKRHLGAYICKGGRKSLRGGYYMHVQPGHSLLAFGCYYLPTNILTSVRHEIVGNIEAWREAVECDPFVNAFGRPGNGSWKDDAISPKGFGLTALKTMPKGFAKDHPQAQYLRMKDYCCWVSVPNDFFAQPDWMDRALHLATIAQPMMNIVNSVVDDYI